MRNSCPPLPKHGVCSPEFDVNFNKATADLRKKATGARQWLVLYSIGKSQVIEAGKHTIMRRTGLPARDLRILDPLLTYPSTILGRETAIVINIEHIKAIITAHEVLLQNFGDPSVAHFVEQLRRRIYRHNRAVKSQEGRVNGENTDWTNLYDLADSQSTPVSTPKLSGSLPEKDEDSKRDGLSCLPFEFIALEACLKAGCSCLDNEARTLEQEANPALDKLTLNISTLNLEHVRQIKNQLVSITGRVQKVRDELEQLLDDDEDMAEMYLTVKILQHHENSVSSIDEQAGIEGEVLRSDLNDRITDDFYAEDDHHHTGNQQDHLLGAFTTLDRDNHGNHTSRSAINKHLDVQELEMLLEAYFVQIDGTLNKLSTLREYVDDTEDYINIMLDDKQNNLLQMGVMLSTANMALNASVVVAGVFGMNIVIDLFDEHKHGWKEFVWTICGCSAGSILLYVAAIGLYKRKRLVKCV